LISAAPPKAGLFIALHIQRPAHLTGYFFVIELGSTTRRVPLPSHSIFLPGESLHYGLGEHIPSADSDTAASYFPLPLFRCNWGLSKAIGVLLRFDPYFAGSAGDAPGAVIYE
jgi:hypothetical protein